MRMTVRTIVRNCLIAELLEWEVIEEVENG